MYAAYQTSRAAIMRKSATNECGNTLPYLRPKLLKNLDNLGPQPLLNKSLQGYFNDRVEDHIAADPTLAVKSTTPFIYSVAAEEIISKQEISCLDNKLIEARVEWGLAKESQNERWAEANKQQEELYRRIPEFNHYYKDLITRRKRANLAIVQETHQIQEKERTLRKKRKELDALHEVRDATESRLGKFEIFKSYLKQVMEGSIGEFTEVQELTDRYNALANARETLTNATEVFRDTVTKRQRELDSDVSMKSTEILIYRNYLSEMLEYDTVLREKVYWLEDGLLRIKITAAQRTLIIGQIKMAIHNLYRQICGVLHRHATIKLDDTLGQLVDIRISVVEISKLSHDIRRMVKAAHLSAKREAETRAKVEKLIREREERQKKAAELMNKTQKNVYNLFNIANRKSQTVNISKLFTPAK